MIPLERIPISYHHEPIYKWPIYKWLTDHKIDNIHVKRQRQKINYFCPDINKYTIAYESLYKDVLLDRYIYNYFINNDLSSKKTITPADDKVTAGKNGEKAIYITNDNGEKEIVYI